MRRAKYRFVPAPEGFPGKVYAWGNRVLEHHAVWWTNTGEVPLDGEVIHHRNGDGLDNRFENLEKKALGRHTRDHCLKEGPRKLVCPTCGEGFFRSGRYVRTKISIGQKRFFCCRSHGVSFNHRKKGN